MVESAFASLAGTGVVGVVLVLALLALRKKDEDLKAANAALLAEAQARIADAGRFLTMATAMQKDTTTSVIALTDIVKKWEKREEDQERLEREIADRSRPATPQEFKPMGRMP